MGRAACISGATLPCVSYTVDSEQILTHGGAGGGHAALGMILYTYNRGIDIGWSPIVAARFSRSPTAFAWERRVVWLAPARGADEHQHAAVNRPDPPALCRSGSASRLGAAPGGGALPAARIR